MPCASINRLLTFHVRPADSICFIPKLRALSVERNQLPELPFSLWHMTALEVQGGPNAVVACACKAAP